MPYLVAALVGLAVACYDPKSPKLPPCSPTAKWPDPCAYGTKEYCQAEFEACNADAGQIDFTCWVRAKMCLGEPIVIEHPDAGVDQ